MRKILPALLALLLIGLGTQAQDTVQIIDTNAIAKIIVTKSVLKRDRSILHGSYTYLFDNKTAVKGQYNNGDPSGKWVFYLDDGTTERFSGEYKNGKKSGNWTFYDEGKALCVTPYQDGERHGEMIQYYPDGEIRQKRMFNQDTADTAFYYYKSGELESIIIIEKWENEDRIISYYKDGAVFKDVYISGDKLMEVNGVYGPGGDPLDHGDFKQGNGSYNKYILNAEQQPVLMANNSYEKGKKEGHYVAYYPSGKIYVEGFYDGNWGDSTWCFFDENGKVIIKFDYSDLQRNKELKEQAMELREKIPYNIHPEYYKDPDILPFFPGGDMGIAYFLATTKYPEIARENDITGKVYIGFHVNIDGEVEDVDVARGANLYLDKASMEAVEKMPVWTPGLKRGCLERIKMIAPFNYRLK